MGSHPGLFLARSEKPRSVPFLFRRPRIPGESLDSPKCRDIPSVPLSQHTRGDHVYHQECERKDPSIVRNVAFRSFPDVFRWESAQRRRDRVRSNRVGMDGAAGVFGTAIPAMVHALCVCACGLFVDIVVGSVSFRFVSFGFESRHRRSRGTGAPMPHTEPIVDTMMHTHRGPNHQPAVFSFSLLSFERYSRLSEPGFYPRRQTHTNGCEHRFITVNNVDDGVLGIPFVFPGFRRYGRGRTSAP